jgi:cytoskeletal protein CcmA (bactofilin family)
MAKLLSGTRIYGNAVVDTFINVGGNVSANGTISANGLIINGIEI